jgi:hypothetical protein
VGISFQNQLFFLDFSLTEKGKMEYQSELTTYQQKVDTADLENGNEKKMSDF